MGGGEGHVLGGAAARNVLSVLVDVNDDLSPEHNFYLVGPCNQTAHR